MDSKQAGWLAGSLTMGKKNEQDMKKEDGEEEHILLRVYIEHGRPLHYWFGSIVN